MSKLDAALRDYYNANLTKNQATSNERKAKKIVETEFVKISKDTPEYTLSLSNSLDVKVSYADVESEEVDPKLLFAKDPEKFWLLVQVPITNAKDMLGDKEVARLTRIVKKSGLKIEKVKHDAEGKDET